MSTWVTFDIVFMPKCRCEIFVEKLPTKYEEWDFFILTATSVKMAVFWDIAPCNLTYCLTDVSEELVASEIYE
jgi:hypothetical protein